MPTRFTLAALLGLAVSAAAADGDRHLKVVPTRALGPVESVTLYQEKDGKRVSVAEVTKFAEPALLPLFHDGKTNPTDGSTVKDPAKPDPTDPQLTPNPNPNPTEPTTPSESRRDRTLGILAFAVGFVGIFLPLVPTVPLMLLAAFFFGRSNPAWERRILAHPHLGPPIRAWRERGAIPLRAKVLSTVLIAISAGTGWWVLEDGLRFVPGLFGAVVLAWMWSRPHR